MKRKYRVEYMGNKGWEVLHNYRTFLFALVATGFRCSTVGYVRHWRILSIKDGWTILEINRPYDIRRHK